MRKKIGNKSWQKKLNQDLTDDLYFGKKRYRDAVQRAENMTKDVEKLWENLALPTSEFEEDCQKLVVAFAEYTASLKKRIEKANEYRAERKIIHCHYEKYHDKRKKQTYFVCSFFSVKEKQKDARVFCLHETKHNKNGIKAVDVEQGKSENLGLSIEQGRFRYTVSRGSIQHIYFYPSNGTRYGFIIRGKSDQMRFKPL